jgi:hypothetical protein
MSLSTKTNAGGVERSQAYRQRRCIVGHKKGSMPALSARLINIEHVERVWRANESIGGRS